MIALMMAASRSLQSTVFASMFFYRMVLSTPPQFNVADLAFPLAAAGLRGPP